jgi:hypothetical protein
MTKGRVDLAKSDGLRAAEATWRQLCTLLIIRYL